MTNPPEDMVSRVARAMCRHDHRLAHPAANEATLDGFVERDWWTWEGMARAAIAAMRPPIAELTKWIDPDATGEQYDRGYVDGVERVLALLDTALEPSP
jgi:hypothetical protein